MPLGESGTAGNIAFHRHPSTTGRSKDSINIKNCHSVARMWGGNEAVTNEEANELDEQ